jgi:glycosyltransferase involved in cell wall biosynthesis
MLGDEYVDCGYWTKDRLEYRLVKRYERRLFHHADGVVVLTRALARWLREHDAVGARPDLEVVPCCVDLAKFAPDEEARARVRAELGVSDDQLLVIYSGSLGTWYLEPEMARFVGALREATRARGLRVAFACFTPSDASGLVARLREAGLSPAAISARKVPPSRMPEHLSAGDIGLSFIQSCFSKKGSSPTKVAEYLACGSVVVANGDIGDQADLEAEEGACVILGGFGGPELQRGARRAVELATSRPRAARVEATRACSRRHFGLEEVGIPRYAALYERLARARLARPGVA